MTATLLVAVAIGAVVVAAALCRGRGAGQSVGRSHGGAGGDLVDDMMLHDELEPGDDHDVLG